MKHDSIKIDLRFQKRTIKPNYLFIMNEFITFSEFEMLAFDDILKALK